MRDSEWWGQGGATPEIRQNYSGGRKGTRISCLVRMDDQKMSSCEPQLLMKKQKQHPFQSIEFLKHIRNCGNSIVMTSDGIFHLSRNHLLQSPNLLNQADYGQIKRIDSEWGKYLVSQTVI